MLWASYSTFSTVSPLNMPKIQQPSWISIPLWNSLPNSGKVRDTCLVSATLLRLDAASFLATNSAVPSGRFFLSRARYSPCFLLPPLWHGSKTASQSTPLTPSMTNRARSTFILRIQQDNAALKWCSRIHCLLNLYRQLGLWESSVIGMHRSSQHMAAGQLCGCKALTCYWLCAYI